MEIPKEIKDMVGNSYIFSGNFLNSFDIPETELLIKDVRISEFNLTEGNIKKKCVEFFINFDGENLWTKPFPIR